MGRNHLGVGLLNLEIGQETMITSINDVVLFLVVLHRARRNIRLVAELRYSLLEPDAGAPRRLIFGVELIIDVRIGERVGDLRCLRGIR